MILRRGYPPLFLYQRETKDLRENGLHQGDALDLGGIGAKVGRRFRGGFWRGAVFFAEEFDDPFVGGTFQEANLVLHAFMGFEKGGADVGERTGAFGGDAIGGEKIAEIAEDVVDVDLGEEIAGRSGEFAREVTFVGIGSAGIAEGVFLLVVGPQGGIDSVGVLPTGRRGIRGFDTMWSGAHLGA